MPIKLKACPCGNSSEGKEWLMVCTDCKQSWHGSCANLKGAVKLNKSGIDALSKTWLCPWCFACPFQRPSNHPSALNHQRLLDASVSGTISQELTDSIADAVKRSVPVIDFSSIKDGLMELGKNIAELKTQRISSNDSEHQSGQRFDDSCPVSRPATQLPREPVQLECPESPYAHHSDNFLEDDELNEVEGFLAELKASGSLQRENGHSTALFGSPYRYTGSKTPADPEPIPPLLEKVIDKLTEKLNLVAPINSVLINHYAASNEDNSTDSFIAHHSDDEPVILAESAIVTLSIGGKRLISFEPIHNKTKVVPDLEVKNNSVYSMTRRSQGWYHHGISPSSEAREERYSLTFRSVSEKFQRSVLILGDSNTKDIKFGNGSGRVGASYPGKRVKAAKVNSIDVNECIGYSNIFICCGTNNLRCENVRGDNDICNTVEELRCKLEIIKQLCPKAKVFVSPVLPSRLPRMNQNIMRYNKLVNSMLMQYFPDVWFQSVRTFLDNQGLLSTRLARGSDEIHLGPRGIAKFVSYFKSCIFSREVCDRKGSLNRSVNKLSYPTQESAPPSMGQPP